MRIFKMATRILAGVASCARAGLDLVLPARCAGCRAREGVERGVCGRCRGELDCFTVVRARLGSSSLVASSPPIPVVSVGRYGGLLRQLLIAYKERGYVALRHDLGSRLAELIVATGLTAGLVGSSGRLTLVPVPSSAASRRARGHEPVTALARAAARSLRRRGIPVVVLPVLRHGRAVADQSGLSAAGRRLNLAGAFIVPARQRRRLRRGEVVIIDDIVTTGATAAEAVRAIQSAGSQVRAVVALAATVRRHPAAHQPPVSLRMAAWAG